MAPHEKWRLVRVVPTSSANQAERRNVVWDFLECHFNHLPLDKVNYLKFNLLFPSVGACWRFYWVIANSGISVNARSFQPFYCTEFSRFLIHIKLNQLICYSHKNLYCHQLVGKFLSYNYVLLNLYRFNNLAKFTHSFPSRLLIRSEQEGAWRDSDAEEVVEAGCSSIPQPQSSPASPSSGEE